MFSTRIPRASPRPRFSLARPDTLSGSGAPPSRQRTPVRRKSIHRPAGGLFPSLQGRVHPIVFGSTPERFFGGCPMPFAHFRVHPIVFGSEPESFFGGSPMPFVHFSGPPNRLRERTRKFFRRKSYAVCSFFGSAHLQNANESFVGGSPTPFAHCAPERFF